mmetsp:Transcript_166621/g.535071  ORF Transcript_166621/g.535071 Transcript_166621/m.535071 type:complete len:235 (-) Transcript_166621:564-1268(-)
MIFDGLLVMSALVDNLLGMVSAMNGNTDFSHARLLRIMKITRLIRVLRFVRVVRFIRALRIMIYSIGTTMKSVLWAVILLFIVIYCFALLFTQAANDHRQERTHAGHCNHGLLRRHQHVPVLGKFRTFRPHAAGVGHWWSGLEDAPRRTSHHTLVLAANFHRLPSLHTVRNSELGDRGILSRCRGRQALRPRPDYQRPPLGQTHPSAQGHGLVPEHVLRDRRRFNWRNLFRGIS